MHIFYSHTTRTVSQTELSISENTPLIKYRAEVLYNYNDKFQNLQGLWLFKKLPVNRHSVKFLYWIRHARGLQSHKQSISHKFINFNADISQQLLIKVNTILLNYSWLMVSVTRCGSVWQFREHSLTSQGKISLYGWPPVWPVRIWPNKQICF